MSVRALITMVEKDGTVKEKITIPFRGWIELAVWMEKHHGEYCEVNAKPASVKDMRQGRE